MKAADWRSRIEQTSLALRIAASSAALGLVVVATATAIAYWSLSRQLDERVAGELGDERKLLQHVLSSIPTVADIAANLHQIDDLLVSRDNLHVALIDPVDGRVLVSSSLIAVESVARLHRPGRDPMTLEKVIHWGSAAGRTYASLESTGTVEEGRTVRFVISEDLGADEKLLKGFARASSIGIPFVLILLTLGPWLVARAGLLPLRRFVRLSSSITSRSLAQRVEVEGLPAELKALAHGLNAMLARLDEGVTRLSEFSGDLAHEMRTPVAILLGRTQVALSKQRSVEELRDTLAGNVDELDRLSRLISDMLFLAQAEQDATAPNRIRLDLGAEARRVAEFLSVVADDRNVRIEVNGDASVSADSALVQRAIINLMSNAVRHAHVSSTVGVAVNAKPGTVTLSVANQGSAIPKDQLSRMFERFVRLDPSRTRSDGGAGLGLAIVSSIMSAHGGSVQASSDDAGLTTFTLTFPAP